MNPRTGQGQVIVSAIIPTIGRAESLRRLLLSLANQSRLVNEVVIADASPGNETLALIEEPCWHQRGLEIKRIAVATPNTVRQRRAAIQSSKGALLLLLDDDVELQPDCLEQMTDLLRAAPDIVAVTADFANQSWPQPTTLWRWYLRYVLGLPSGAWQGRVIGPLLRFGYHPVPTTPVPIEWLGSGNSLVRRDAYDEAGGFADVFLHRSTINEDIDLSIKLRRRGRIRFCPAARMAHYHAAGGRVSARVAAADDLFNRYIILRHTQQRGAVAAFRLVLLYFFVETLSSIVGALRRLDFTGLIDRLIGRLAGLRCIFHRPARLRD